MWLRAALISGSIFILVVGVLCFSWWQTGWDLQAMSAIGSATSPIIGLLSLFALVAAILAVRLQEKESTRQHGVYLDQRQREQNAELRKVYEPFVSAVSRYHEAISEYMNAMAKSGSDADELTRQEWQEKSLSAYDQLTQTTQAIILADPDERRNSLRWRLQQEIRLEPWVDNEENQHDWPDVLLYEVTRRTQEFVELRHSLYREFGHKVVEPSDAAREQQRKMEADLKAKADRIESRIDAQLKEQAIADAARRAKEKGP
jgi:hypothetical protein